MAPPSGTSRRPANDELPPQKRHDGSLDGYRRQRRLVLQRRLADEGLVPRRPAGRTQ